MHSAQKLRDGFNRAGPHFAVEMVINEATAFGIRISLTNSGASSVSLRCAKVSASTDPSFGKSGVYACENILQTRSLSS